MKRALFLKADEEIVAFSRAQAAHTKAAQKMWSALIPLIVDVVKAESKKPGYKRGVPHRVIKARVRDMLHEYYSSSVAKKQLIPGRHIAEGAIVIAINLGIVTDAIRWAAACELIVSPNRGNLASDSESMPYLLKKS